jgi:hypothetical protein
VIVEEKITVLENVTVLEKVVAFGTVPPWKVGPDPAKIL